MDLLAVQWFRHSGLVFRRVDGIDPAFPIIRNVA